MLEDAQIGILVTTEKLMDVLPAHWAQVVCLNGWEILASLSENLGVMRAENLAYVIYERIDGSAQRVAWYIGAWYGWCKDQLHRHLRAGCISPECAYFI
jgi:hypothetical protein